ncbi:MAG: hypothetical protein EAZ61_07465 [Oscillatoriales cyanobacterium]|nr:MAG: hypothetical protein EAZ61_07465 [Oscillatoriales cyanobacterium]
MESGRHSSSEDPLSGGSQILGAILAACTLGIPLIAVLSFSTPLHLVDLDLRSPLSESMMPQEEAAATGFQLPSKVIKP